MIAKLQCTVVDCPDPGALGAFYQGILGGELDDSDPAWVWLTLPDGVRFAFQEVLGYRPPRWPDPQYPQQFHLDFDVEDVDAAQEQVLALGAALLHDSGGRNAGFRVFTDPAGHPFCLCYG
jgi:predicted enzyme related to lactoylglutathione lyase